LKAYLDNLKLPHGEIGVKLCDDDWVENWKKYYKPIVAGRYVIVPKWLRYDSKDNLTEILIDPGMAFGTGEHESTRMCLRLLSEIDLKNKDVFDIGTGSGILGIAALKSRAKSCYMCDIDSIAVSAAVANAKLNKVEKKAKIEEADLLSKSIGTCDVVLANLTADILKLLSQRLTEVMRKNATLICSGIIDKRLSEVKEVFKSKGLTLKKELADGDWRALLFTL